MTSLVVRVYSRVKNLSYMHRSSNWIGKQILNLCNDGSNPFRCANFNGDYGVTVAQEFVELLERGQHPLVTPNITESL